ncbi:MAG: cobalt ECF transporter T component CbiQ [Actinomycetota bacterium]|nr:cobalt ECF transporter T component CbiQ [Actinomycetota bacterium]
MSGGHAHGLFVHRDSLLHKLPPQCKVLAALLFVLAVVATPREAFWAYAAYAALLVGAARLGRVPIGFLSRRLVLEAPFLLFALFLPLVGEGERIEVGGIPLAIEGLWAAWNIVAKATLGLWATLIVAATTPIAEILHGLEHLRMPRVITAIAGFMIRYTDVITGEMQRMKIAREARGYDPRFLWQARALTATAGTLFIRSYERGERVYLAMLSRGFTGSLPLTAHNAAVPRQWAMALLLPAAALVVNLSSWAAL